MKKIVTLVFAMLLTGSLAFAQTASQSTDQGTSTTTKKTKTKKAHKGGKKSKKGADSTATPAPSK